MAAVIVLGILGPAIKLGKCIAAPIKRQLNYFCCFSSNLQILKEEAEKLECQKVGLEMDVATAKNNARPIDPRVNPWLKQVNENQQTNSGLEAQVTSVQGRCCLSRYSIGRKVCKTAEYMKQIREDGREIKAVSHDRPAPASMVPGRAMRKFESRTAIEEDIMAALREGQVKIVGICGMGGVGKTTLAKNVMDRVREEKLFDICVMVIVSQRIEKDKIQGEIAENLGLELKEKFLSARASVLRSRLTNGERILIVVDDIWQYIDLEEIRIQGCYILLTSRNRHVLSEMDVKLICQMETLTEEEALSFFQEKLGFYDQNCSSRFAEIAKECKCLPLALECVAGLLKHQQSHIFMLEDVLQQLKNANPEDLPQVIEHVYIPLKLSYDHLSSENAKFIFLMCCLLPEDHNIPLEDLTAYAMGLRMFEGISDLEQTRNITYSIVQNLKSCFLLLEGEYEGYVKMHDVNRDVAIHIASKEKHFIKRGDSSIWMSPYLGQRNELSKGSPFPNLRLLLVDNSVDEEILDSGISFEGMNNLNVLSIRKNDSLSSMPQFQKNLRTLIFKSCAMESMCGVGGLVNLEILICRTCRNIKELPLEMERLERLRLLGIYTCGYLQKIRKGVLSSLKKLEELEIEQSFKEWEVEDNACLSELECLSNLTCLKIEVKDFTLAAQQISLPPKIKKYDIKVGDYPWYDPGKCEKIMLLVFPVDITLGKWILEYMANAEFLYLEGNVSNCLDLGKAQDIRYLRIEKCSTISSIAFPHLLESIQLERLDNLEEIICDAPNSNLSSVIISSCDRLQNLFPLSTAKDCFPQLQHLRISSCDMMEKVFVYENEKNIDIGHGSQHATAITFPKLKTLRLENLPRLKVSYQGIESIDFPMLTEIRIKKCPQLNASFGGDDNSLQLLCKENVSIFDNYLREIAPLSTQILIGSFTQLEDLRIEDLGNLKSLFSFSMAQNLDRLDCLSISRCTEMVQSDCSE